MRLKLFMFATCAALWASVSAHADTFTQDYTINGSGSSIGTTSFSEFDTTDGTLTSITLSMSGTFISQAPSSTFLEVAPGDSSSTDLVAGSDGTSQGISIPFSVSGTVPGADLSFFEGTGSQNLLLIFNLPADASGTGSITYNYTPATAPVTVTPEPSSFILLGSGALGLMGAARRKLRKAS